MNLEELELQRSFKLKVKLIFLINFETAVVQIIGGDALFSGSVITIMLKWPATVFQTCYKHIQYTHLCTCSNLSLLSG